MGALGDSGLKFNEENQEKLDALLCGAQGEDLEEMERIKRDSVDAHREYLMGLIEKIDSPEKVDDGLEVVLDFESPGVGDAKNEVFYRYSVGECKVWMSQNVENGFAFAHVETTGDLKDFLIYPGNRQGPLGGQYPHKFYMEVPVAALLCEDVDGYIEKVRRAQGIVGKIEEFFRTSKHYELYCSLRGEKTVGERIADATEVCKGLRERNDGARPREMDR